AANMTTIEVVGHNIANANNPDYRRQQAILKTTETITTGNLGAMGTGVQVSRIEAHYDRFLFRQVVHERSNQGMWDSLAGGLDGVERVFNDLGDNGLSARMAEFWGAWEDLANNPEGVVERATLTGKSSVLTSELNSMGEDLAFQRQQLNGYFREGINEINRLADSLGEMNQAIHDSEVLGGDNYDLRDKQLAQLTELSEMIDIEYNEDSTGQLNISLLGGQPLVLGNAVFSLAFGADDQGDLHAYFNDKNAPIDDLMCSGKMKGWIDARDTLIQAQDDLNRLSSALIFSVNQGHFQGYNLDGETGTTFFDHRIALAEGQDNVGDATISFHDDSNNVEAPEGIAWATLANYDDFEIRFTDDYEDGNPSDDFIVVNTTTGVELDPASYEVVDPDATDGSLIINFNDTTDLSLIPDKGYHVELKFGSSGTAPRKGDTFTLSFSANAARSMVVSQDLDNPDKIAISDNYFEVPGNNKIALQIVQLQHRQVVDERYTFSEFHSALVGRVGLASHTAQTQQSQSKMVLDQLNIREESDTGVSIDEEMVELIKFQQSYHAAAKLISIIDELVRATTEMGG
ncbi:MAG: flagellar hook-associated protein FlgK, partial [Thermodesulfobacteriota bacterium]|nr:flagellar hook-associated protein FlgK [Thermodesulfobacteriota bacterium]